MTPTRTRRLRGQAAILVGLAVLAYGLIRPVVDGMNRRQRVSDAFASVDGLRSALEAYQRENGELPRDTDVGHVPDGLAPFLPVGLVYSAPSYRLDVERWERVVVPPVPPDFDPEDSVPPPAPYPEGMVGVSVHSHDPDILAELLTRYGRNVSFVRDSIWTLVTTRPGTGPSGRPVLR